MKILKKFCTTKDNFIKIDNFLSKKEIKWKKYFIG